MRFRSNRAGRATILLALAGLLCGMIISAANMASASTVLGLDFNTYPSPSTGTIAADGYSFVSQYLAGPGHLTAASAQDFRSHGISVVANWEYNPNTPLNGYSGGVSDAQTALADANAAGFPSNLPIYFSVDFNPSSSQIGTIIQYFSGVASVLGLSRTGAYGGIYTISQLFNNHAITYGWQTYAWSNGQWDSRAQLRQIQNGINVGGTTVDEDEATTSSYGQWPASGGGGGGGGNPYTPTGVCGSAYNVIDSHAISGATIYLLYDSANGDNCVTTLATSPVSAVPMNATLTVQGGSSGSDPGTYRYYAGPVFEHAPTSCVEWGGAYNGSSWTSNWSHCGSGATNPYTPTGVCGAGYGVIDSHAISGATVYLLYDSANGYNCVTTLATSPVSAVPMNATLTVEGGGSGSNPGTFQYYAGPVYEYAPNSCVEWGGAYNGSSWTSSWSHCGGGSSNPYTPTGVCGAGYGVIDSHAISGATIYLLYDSANGYNCVTTLATSPVSAVPMNATLAVQGGGSASNPGTFQFYAGPVYEYAPASCVEWGGAYNGSSWTSSWSHCG